MLFLVLFGLIGGTISWLLARFAIRALLELISAATKHSGR